MEEFKDSFKEWLMHTYDLTEEEYAKFIKFFKQIMDGDVPICEEMFKGGGLHD